MRNVLRRKLSQLFVDGLPVAFKTLAFPEVKNGSGLHFTVGANSSSLRVIELLLLSITPVCLQVKADEGRPEILINTPQASVIGRGIDAPTVLEHGPGCSDGA